MFCRVLQERIRNPENQFTEGSWIYVNELVQVGCKTAKLPTPVHAGQ
jgi:hypothetical protein